MTIEISEGVSKDIFVDGGNITVSIHTWANGDGANILVHSIGASLPLRMAGAFRWEELEVIAAALSAAINS